MSTLATPHDGFCKYVLGRTEQAGAFLAHFLPTAIVAPLDLATLAPLPGSFVDQALANHHSDLLFSVTDKDGAPTLVYVLFEHKSEADKKTPLQLLRYMERIWDAHVKDGGSLPLPPILPIVVHQGAAPWPFPPTFESIVQARSDFSLFVPKFAFHLVDLCRINDADLPTDPFLGVALRVMKHVQLPDLPEAIAAAAILFRALLQRPTGLDFLKTVLKYIFNTTTTPRRKDVWTALEHAVSPEGDKHMQTIAESWVEEGFNKGIIEGMNLGRAEGVQELADTIVEVLELRFSSVPLSLKERIQKIGELDALKALRRKLRDASSVDECERIVSNKAAH